MFGSIIDQIQKQHGEKALIGVYLCIIDEIKKTLNQQQKELDKIKKQYSKIEKERLDKKKKKENALIFFNSVYTGKTNKKNLPDGKGTITSPDGGKYVGEFKDGLQHGHGTSINPNTGRKYVGEFKDGNVNGYGTATYSNGTKYVGEFKDFQYH